MKGYLYLFFALLLFSPFISAVDYDTNIYVAPFVFGVIKGDSGDVITPVLPSSLSQGSFSQLIGYQFQSISVLNPSVRNNNLLILRLPVDGSARQLRREPGMGRYYVLYNTVDNPNKNINVLFRID